MWSLTNQVILQQNFIKQELIVLGSDDDNGCTYALIK